MICLFHGVYGWITARLMPIKSKLGDQRSDTDGSCKVYTTSRESGKKQTHPDSSNLRHIQVAEAPDISVCIAHHVTHTARRPDTFIQAQSSVHRTYKLKPAVAPSMPCHARLSRTCCLFPACMSC